MQTRPAIATALMLLTGAILLGCSGSSDSSSTPQPTPPPPTAVPAQLTPTPSTAPATQVATTPPAATPSPVPPTPPQPSATPAAASGLESLSLVFVDTRKGNGGEIYVGDADGANARLVTTQASYRRPLALAGRYLAAVEDGGLFLLDLGTGNVTPIKEDRIVLSGAFLSEDVFFYSASGSCTQGGASVYRVEMPSGEVTELIKSDQNLTISGLDVTSNTLALLPRGCDVGIAVIDLYDALTGQLRNSLAVDGCGWGVALPAFNKVVVSWQACTPPFNHAGASATIYDATLNGLVGSDVTAPDGGSNAAAWLPRPGASEVALGTTKSVGEGPGSARGAGIYLLNLDTLTFRQVAPPEGAEQYPVAWSPDGRYLLYALVEAQGVCHYGYVDVEGPPVSPVPIDAGVTFCGVNGTVVGWAELP